MFPMKLNVNPGRRHEELCLTVSCSQEECSFEGKTQYVSSHDLRMEVPTARVKKTLLKFLNQDVTVHAGNVTVTGKMRSYTIDGNHYLIGVAISRPDRMSWRRLLEERTGFSLFAQAPNVST